MQVSKYPMTSLNDARLTCPRDRSEAGRQYLSSTSCNEENESFWVCIMYVRLERRETSSIRAPIVCHNVEDCGRHRNCPTLNATCSISIGGPGSTLSSVSSSSHGWWCGLFCVYVPRMGCTADSAGTSLRTFRYVCRAVTYSHFAIVGYRLVA